MPPLQTALSEPGLRASRPAIPARQAVVTTVTIAAALAGIVLRWVHLGRQSLWLDEGHTEYVFRFSPGELVRFLAQTSAHPPLYFLLQHYWRVIFGDSEFSLRTLSAIFGTLSFPIFYLLAQRVLKDGAAVALAMWLFAFSVMQIWYSQGARAYELASFLLLAALYALVLFLEKRSAVLFAAILLCVTASIYTQNMMLFTSSP
jgi:mannosyltransferase